MSISSRPCIVDFLSVTIFGRMGFSFANLPFSQFAQSAHINKTVFIWTVIHKFISYFKNQYDQAIIV